MADEIGLVIHRGGGADQGAYRTAADRSPLVVEYRPGTAPAKGCVTVVALATLAGVVGGMAMNAEPRWYVIGGFFLLAPWLFAIGSLLEARSKDTTPRGFRLDDDGVHVTLRGGFPPHGYEMPLERLVNAVAGHDMTPEGLPRWAVMATTTFEPALLLLVRNEDEAKRVADEVNTWLKARSHIPAKR